MSDEAQDLGKEVGQSINGRLEALRVGKSRELVQVVAQTRQIAENGVMFLDEVLHDLGIDGCLPDIFGQCAESRRPRPVTDDVILQGAVSYGHGPALLMHLARFRATAFVLLFHCSRINVYVCICVNVSMCQYVNMSMRKCVFVQMHISKIPRLASIARNDTVA